MKKIALLTGLLALVATAAAQPLAFPSAEGYGKFTVGGRGGRVIEVTNLDDSGPGSLRAAVEAQGARTVVFRVSGTIDLQRDLTIRNPYITIAGQTAPGDGITIKRYPLNIGADQVIIRYIRIRLGDESGRDTDALSGRGRKNIIIDHVSSSWSIDETLSVYHCDSVTIQWCLMSESLYHSNHAKGNHGYGGIWGGNHNTQHHNLFAHHTSRNPRWVSGSGYNDYRNNVVYNWGFNSGYGGENQRVGDPSRFFTAINIVANYYKPGPATSPGEVRYRIVGPSYRETLEDAGKWYVAGNFVEGAPKRVNADNWNGGVQFSSGDPAVLRLDKPWDAMPIRQQSAKEAYESVLKLVGASLRRDAIDERIVREVRGGYATYEGASYKKRIAASDEPCGIIDTPSDVGGWPELKSLPAPADSDRDGMPDAWERANGLDADDPQDGQSPAPDGYTWLEKYLNGICGE